MPQHDEYGKQVMKLAAGTAYTDHGRSVEIDYGAGQPARIDGTVGKTTAVEIESRVAKQVRGAVLDLICHNYPKKLLVLLPVHMSNPEATAAQCSAILGRFLSPEDYRVVVLRGTGDLPQLDTDVALVKAALNHLWFRGGG